MRWITLHLLTFLLLIGCARSQEMEAPIERTFNTDAFVGLAETAAMNDKNAALDYALDAESEGTLEFTRCRQVETTAEEDVIPPQRQLFDLLRVNCLALKRFAESKKAKRSHFPGRLTKEMVNAFPAAAVPLLNDEDQARRRGRALSDYEDTLEIVIESGSSAQVTTLHDELYYEIMARADFDGDGNQDWLIRVERHARDAFGEAVDLVLLSRTAQSVPIEIIWRR